MNYRHAEILPSQDLGESGTKIIDLDIIDPISRITLLHQPVGGSDDIIAHPMKNITKLELIDGSEVLYSLTGFQGHGLNIIEAPRTVTTYLDERSGGTPMLMINMDFGRHLWDPLLALVPPNFTNLQLKLTWNEKAYDASVGSHAFMIYGHLFDEKEVSPVGFLMNKEIKSYQPSAGGYEYTDLPTDYPMRKLIIQAFKKTAGVRGICQAIKLSEDNDKRVPIDGDIYNLRSFLDFMNGEAVDIIRINADSAADECYVTAHNILSAVASSDVVDKTCRVYLYAGGYVIVEHETAAGGVNLAVRGKNPHGLIGIPFGDQGVIDDWYDVTKLGSLKVRILGGPNSVTGDTISVLTQQIRRYAA